jgi:hypothetical protein
MNEHDWWKELYQEACDGTKLKLRENLTQEEAAAIMNWAEMMEEERIATLEWNDQVTYRKLFKPLP